MMKKGLLPILIGLLLISCSRKDDTDKECTQDCTLIHGQFVTSNNTPLKDVTVRVDFEESGSGFFNSNERKIQSARTDGNGVYGMRFYLKEFELENRNGWFSLNIDASNLNPNDYIIPDQFSLGYMINSISRRDTIISKSFYIPTKAFITVNLNGFLPQAEGDYFEVSTLFPAGIKIGEDQFSNNIYQRGRSGNGAYKASSTNNTFNKVYGAADEVNIINIVKRKNGEIENVYIELFIPGNNTINLSFDY